MIYRLKILNLPEDLDFTLASVDNFKVYRFFGIGSFKVYRFFQGIGGSLRFLNFPKFDNSFEIRK